MDWIGLSGKVFPAGMTHFFCWFLVNPENLSGFVVELEFQNLPMDADGDFEMFLWAGMWDLKTFSWALAIPRWVFLVCKIFENYWK